MHGMPQAYSNLCIAMSTSFSTYDKLSLDGPHDPMPCLHRDLVGLPGQDTGQVAGNLLAVLTVAHQALCKCQAFVQVQ